MSKFFSQAEIRKMDKKLNEDDLLNINRYKYELKNAINDEFHRINVDSAKKKAVMQRMNYDGFHQMVLGADLKGMKPEEITNIQAKGGILNGSTVHDKLKKDIDVLKDKFVVDEDQNLVKGIKDVKLDFEEDKLDFKEFMKKWNKFPNFKEKCSFCLDIGVSFFEDNLRSSLIDSDFFVQMLLSFLTEIDAIIQNNEFDLLRIEQLLRILEILIENKQSKTLKRFLSKKHKTQILETKNSLDQNETLLNLKEQKSDNTLDRFNLLFNFLNN